MKIKKIIAGVAAAAMAVSTMAAMSVSAVNEGGTVIDFEDGDCSFVYMNVDDAGADSSVLSVEDYNGSKRLKVDVQDKTKGPKVWFDLDKIMDRSNTVQIRRITFDLTLVPKSAEGIIGWAGGAVGAAGGFDLNAAGKGQVNPSWSDKSWEGGAYDPGAAAEVKIERKFMMKNEQYTEEGINPFFGLMRWAAADDADQYVMYIDNIQFYDALTGGNLLTVGVTPAPAETEAAPEETTAAPEETTAAPAETEAAPAEADDEVAVDDADEEAAPAPAETAAPVAEPAPAETAAPAPVADAVTTPAATGNVAVASIAAVMAIAGAAAIVAKKRK